MNTPPRTLDGWSSLIALLSVVACSNAVDGKSSANGGSDAGSPAGSSGVAGAGKGGAGATAGTGGTGGGAGSAGTSASSGSGGTGGSAGSAGSAGNAGSGGQAGGEAACNEPTPACSNGDPTLSVTCCEYCDCIAEACPDAFASRDACITACKSYREDQLCCAQSYCIAAMTGPHCDHAVIPSGACPM